MSATFVLGEEDCCSKVTSGLMGAIFYSVLGKQNSIINGWQVSSEDLAKVILTTFDLNKDKALFNAFMDMFPDTYWVKSMKSDPLFYANRLTEVYQTLSNTLAEMIINKTEYIYAAWE